MIDPSSIRGLTRPQLSQFRRFDMDCEDLRCNECPLGMEPVRVTLRNGNEFTYKCAPAYASHLYSK